MGVLRVRRGLIGVSEDQRSPSRWWRGGAAVVSFLGGIHWGIGLRYAATETPGHAFHLVWGTVPPLLAWVAIMMPAFAGLPLLGLVLVACYAVDRKTWADAGLSHWLPLRWRLTVVATLACVFGAGGT